ncbi:MAG: hypothetical protein JNM62_15345 [Flavobacteriales bacterium]|nr:hypothetical protein [Flavobacteriales bacterium]
MDRKALFNGSLLGELVTRKAVGQFQQGQVAPAAGQKKTAILEDPMPLRIDRVDVFRTAFLHGLQPAVDGDISIDQHGVHERGGKGLLQALFPTAQKG